MLPASPLPLKRFSAVCLADLVPAEAFTPFVSALEASLLVSLRVRA
jgi:hypothetical protein